MNTKLATAQIRVKNWAAYYSGAQSNLVCLSKIIVHSISFHETLIITGSAK